LHRREIHREGVIENTPRDGLGDAEGQNQCPPVRHSPSKVAAPPARVPRTTARAWKCECAVASPPRAFSFCTKEHLPRACCRTGRTTVPLVTFTCAAATLRQKRRSTSGGGSGRDGAVHVRGEASAHSHLTTASRGARNACARSTRALRLPST